jgi:tripartite-type tricarboxylate transporter receptor subunit TctC
MVVPSRRMPSRHPRPRSALHYLRRRRVVGAALIGALPGGARAQAPGRPLRVIFGFPAGSTPDIILRLLAEGMAERLGHPVIVDNRPGATGAIAAEAAFRAAPDGETLLLMPHGALLLPALRRDLGFDPAVDFVPVAGMASSPLVLVVPPSLGTPDLAALVAEARSRGDRFAYGMSGIGASPHLAMALLARAGGFAPTAVPFRGDPEIFTALLGGQIQAAFVLAPTAIPLIREGRLRALAVTSRERLSALPAVPTSAEAAQPDVLLSSWWGLVAPRGTPSAAVARLSGAARATLAAPGFGRRLNEVGALVMDLGPEEFGHLIRQERERLLALYAALGLVPG